MQLLCLGFLGRQGRGRGPNRNLGDRPSHNNLASWVVGCLGHGGLLGSGILVKHAEKDTTLLM